MARSVLNSFVSGTRQMLAVQLFVSVGSVALAGYTIAVTNNAIRERDRLNERVIQLEEALGQAGIAPPQAIAIPQQPVQDIYPPSGDPMPTEDAPVDQSADTDPQPPAEQAPPVVTETPPAPDAAKPDQTPPPQSVDTPQTQNPPAFDPAQILRELLTPPPPLRSVVLHIRARADYDEAQIIARQLSADGLTVSIDIMPPNDQRQSGYAYFHGRQSRPAADLVQRLQDAARSAEIAAWSVQLRGTALPASGEYTADRLDIVLPALPTQNPVRVNPQILQQRARIAPNAVQSAPQQDPNAPR